MTWLRVLTALGLLAAAACALFVFARATGHATRSTTTAAPDLRREAEGSGLFARSGNDD
ncbi:hypothetical protein [Kitasatospora sp. NPDC101183]|uniref:hypothetical protein n=1 Tax=Kitasatospora sp. NPDC101183 TaxID=3364100 RepID=UPI00382513CA